MIVNLLVVFLNEFKVVNTISKRGEIYLICQSTLLHDLPKCIERLVSKRCDAQVFGYKI